MHYLYSKELDLLINLCLMLSFKTSIIKGTKFIQIMNPTLECALGGCNKHVWKLFEPVKKHASRKFYSTWKNDNFSKWNIFSLKIDTKTYLCSPTRGCESFHQKSKIIEIINPRVECASGVCNTTFLFRLALGSLALDEKFHTSPQMIFF